MRKKSWFRFHLSTAIVTIIIIGLALLLNQKKRVGDAYCHSGNLGAVFFCREISWGWPWAAYGYSEGLPSFRIDEWKDRIQNGTVLFPDGRKLNIRIDDGNGFSFTEGPTWKPKAIIGNVLVAILTLLVVASITEVILRRVIQSGNCSRTRSRPA